MPVPLSETRGLMEEVADSRLQVHAWSEQVGQMREQANILKEELRSTQQRLEAMEEKNHQQENQLATGIRLREDQEVEHEARMRDWGHEYQFLLNDLAVLWEENQNLGIEVAKLRVLIVWVCGVSILLATALLAEIISKNM